MPIRTLPKDLQNKAIQELNEDPSKVQDQLKLIRTWAAGQAHLKLSSDDQWLLNFLRRCKFDLDVAKERIDDFLTLKSSSPELFQNRDPFSPEIQELLNMGIYLPLHKSVDASEPRVMLCRLPEELVDFEEFDMETAVKLMLMVADISLKDDDSFSICGGIIVIDAAGLAMQHILEGTSVAKKFYSCLKTAYSLEPQSVHVLNAPPFVLSVFNAYKSMLSAEKIAKLHIYDDDNIDELKESIPSSILPEEYGGSCGSVQDLAAEIKKKVESHKDWYLDDAQYCTDETKRVGGKPAREVFGSTSLSGIAELD